jgi:hypothetical protein
MLKKLLLIGLLTTSIVNAYASTPTLSLSNSGSGDSVLVNVAGDPNSPITLYYYSTTASGIQSQTIGTTNSSGTFWTIMSTAVYNVSSSGSVYVRVNGQQSQNASWPYVTTSSSNGSLSLNQTGLVLSQGQTSTLTATNGSSIYLFNNTNPSVVNISINGNQINVSANANGSTVFTVCSGSSSNCVSVYVTVQNTNAQLLTFSQSNSTVITGQSLPISIYGGSGSYTIVSNSNSGAIQASLSGSTLTLYGNSGSGQSSITVCTVDMSSCGIVNVSIGTSNSSTITFSQTSPVLSIGQTVSVSLSGSSGTYSISSNSNPSSVQANISGSAVSLYGVSYGTSNVVVCSSTGSCGTLAVSVSSGGGGGAIVLSQTSLVLVTGQTVGVTVSGGTTPYSVSNSSTNIVQANVSGNIVTLTGLNSGSGTIYICSAGGGCTALSIVVNAATGGTTVNTTPGFSQSTVSLTAGQSSTVSIIGGGGYYLASNTNPNVATAVISGSSVVITGSASGSTAITICQSTSQCNTISVTVDVAVATGGALTINPTVAVGQKSVFTVAGGNNTYYLSSPSTSIFSANLTNNYLTVTGIVPGQGQVSVCSTSTTCMSLTITVTGGSSTSTSHPVSTKYIFNSPLTFGSKGQEVVELQKRLHEEGYFNGTYVATYGNETVTAVKKYQKAHKLSQLGNLGPATRAMLNK